MTDQTENEFTHVGVLKKTQLQISILAKVKPIKTIYGLVGEMAEREWEQAKKDGLVTDAMLNAHWVTPTVKVKSTTKKAVKA